MENSNDRKTFRKTVGLLRMKLIDKYIIRKFLGTFFFSLALILTIAVVFDFAEKIDNFMEKQAPVRAIIFDYYLNFIPYFAMLFAPLFVFISVIFFTSKNGYQYGDNRHPEQRNELQENDVAIFYLGLCYRCLYFPAYKLRNSKGKPCRLDFEDKYYRSSSRKVTVENIHRQVYKNIYVYMGSFNPLSQRGQNFTIEKFSDSGRLESKLSASSVTFDTAKNKWKAMNYYMREIKGNEEIITRGKSIDTALTINPKDFSRDPVLWAHDIQGTG